MLTLLLLLWITPSSSRLRDSTKYSSASSGIVRRFAASGNNGTWNSAILVQLPIVRFVGNETCPPTPNTNLEWRFSVAELHQFQDLNQSFTVLGSSFVQAPSTPSDGSIIIEVVIGGTFASLPMTTALYSRVK